MVEVLIEILIAASKGLGLILFVFMVAGALGWVERKASAMIQDRYGANRASILGFAGLGLVNTMVADPIKVITKEDIVPRGADPLLHLLAPILCFLPALLVFAVIPFGDVLVIGAREINLQVAPVGVGILFLLAIASIGVIGVTLGGWASNNRWALLGGVRGTAQMISYEIAMGLAIVAVVLTYGTLDMQEMARAQGELLWGWLPAWGIFYQPLGFLLLLVAGIAETKRVPFDLPECESELISGYFTEYSGVKYLLFFMADFVEIIIVAALLTTLFFGGWQVPYLMRDGFHFPGGWSLLLPNLVVALLQIASFAVKVVFFCWFQIMIRWTIPRFRYDQLMRLGWKGLLPLGLVNVVLTAILVLAFNNG